MDVLIELLPPSVQQHGDAEFAAKLARIAPEFQQHLQDGAKQQSADHPGVALAQGIEFMRQGEHQVPVINIQ